MIVVVLMMTPEEEEQVDIAVPRGGLDGSFQVTFTSISMVTVWTETTHWRSFARYE